MTRDSKGGDSSSKMGSNFWRQDSLYVIAKYSSGEERREKSKVHNKNFSRTSSFLASARKQNYSAPPFFYIKEGDLCPENPVLATSLPALQNSMAPSFTVKGLPKVDSLSSAPTPIAASNALVRIQPISQSKFVICFCTALKLRMHFHIFLMMGEKIKNFYFMLVGT